MFLIHYHDRIYLDGFRCRDVAKSFKAKRLLFSHGMLYAFRSQYAYVSLSVDDIDSIDDLDTGFDIDVHASFAAGEVAYVLPF